MILDWTCDSEKTITYILGIFLCIGGAVSYLPQYIALIKSKQAKGISELSLLILNIGALCLACNSLILNWWQFECYKFCGFLLCTGNLLAFYQIFIGWIIVFPLYLIFVYFQYKFNNNYNYSTTELSPGVSESLELLEPPNSEKNLQSQSQSQSRSYKTCFYELSYVITYVIFLIVIILLLTIEKFTYNNVNVLYIVAYILGICSMVCSGIVWIPQIIKLIRYKDEEGLSLTMFLIQTPGSAIIIVFQAILNHQDVTTWISYVFNFTEQLIIVIILIVLMIRKYKQQQTLLTKEFSDVGNTLVEDGIYIN